jgi:hypothetical protein
MRLFSPVFGGLVLLSVSVSAQAANLADATYVKELERISGHTWALGQVCLDPSGKVIEGNAGVSRPVEGFPVDTVSCTAHWRYSDGVMYELGHLLAYSAGSFASWDEYFAHRNSAQEPRPATYAEAWADVEKLRSQAGLKPWTESLNQPRCADEVSASTELALPKLVPNPAAKPGELKTVAFVKSVETILASPATCTEQKTRIQALFAQTTVSDPRDWAWISWAARNAQTFFEHRIVRQHIGAQAQMARLAPTADHDAFTSEAFLSKVMAFQDVMATILRFNLAVNGTESEALEKVAPGKNFGQFSQLSKPDQERWLDLVAFQPNGLSALFADPAAREDRLTKFKDACDKRLAEIFGGPKNRVAGSGYELAFKRTALDDDVSRPRWHTFANLHIYDDGRGEPLFIPPGGSALSGGTDENACFVTYYRKFGNFGPSRLVTCHVADAKVTTEKNANGSLKIGMIGGPGGSGGSVYSHSHLMLYPTDKSARLNFIDAFCR